MIPIHGQYIDGWCSGRGQGWAHASIANKLTVCVFVSYQFSSLLFYSGHRPSFRGHSTYRRGLPRRRGTDAPHRLWIDVLRGREVSVSTRGVGTAVTAGEVPQLKVVSGRHSNTRKRPVRTGYSVANPQALQYCPGHPVCLPAK